jgi:hypothetical protein
MNKKPVCNCTICGRPLYHDDPAYGTTTGTIDERIEGFVPSEFEPWLTIACKDCGWKISEAIENLQEELLKAK